MAGQSHGHTLEGDGVALFGVHVPVGDEIAENILDGLGLALGGFAAADQIDVVDLVEIQNQGRRRKGPRQAGGLGYHGAQRKVVRTDDQLAALYT